MKTAGTYSSRLEADLAKLALDRAGIPSVVIGTGVGMEGGAAGVQLLVPSERFEEALKLLAGA
jgi:putative signal transducing protein